MISPSICFNNVSLSYEKKDVFTNLSLELPAGKWVALLGPSGIGKSSLLRAMLGLLSRKEQTSGTVTASNGEPLHPQLSYMAQSDSLLPWLTCLQNATLCLRLREYSRDEYDHKLLEATQLLQQLGLSNELHAYPNALSGGMRQRVALARTLLESKPIVLMDEPFSALDAITRYKLQNLAAALLKNKTVLFITHDPAESLRLADEVYIMQGSPVTLRCVAKFETKAPRELDDTEVVRLQAKIYKELSA